MKGRCRRRSATALRSLRALAVPSLAYPSPHQMASLPRPARAAVMRLILNRVVGPSFRSVVIAYVIRPVSPKETLEQPRHSGFRQETRGAWVVRGCSWSSDSSPPSRPSPAKGKGYRKGLRRGKRRIGITGDMGAPPLMLRQAQHERWRVTCARMGRDTCARTVEGYLCTNGEGTPEHERSTGAVGSRDCDR